MTELLAILFLVFMEGLLSFDNALTLAAMVKPLPTHLQKKALTYGILGAFGFRIIALLFLTTIMASPWVKALGGMYLIYMGVKHFVEGDDEAKVKTLTIGHFWRVVIAVELADIAFSVDSILAAVAVSDKLWVIAIGGILGIIMMRFASTIFIKLIDSYPRLNTTAFLLVTIVGSKLFLEALLSEHLNFHSVATFEFWCFWLAMGGSLLFGFTKKQTWRLKWDI